MTIERFVYIGLSLAITITMMVLGKALFVPLVFAILFALALSPLANFFERKGVNHFFASLWTMLSVLVILSVVISLVSYVFSDIYNELPNIQKRIEQGVNKLVIQFSEITGISMDLVQDNLMNNSGDFAGQLWSFVRNSITFSLITLGNIFLVLFYTLLLVYYRNGIKRVLMLRATEEETKERKQLFADIRNTTQNYFTGILIVMLILGVMNSVGLWVIGIDYAIFWGFLAGFLVIIPYIGTTLGGIFPFLYALATLDTVWQPAAIVIMYYTIQQIEGNFITPRVVGAEINTNVLTILLSMITGGLIWGIAGIILAAPISGILQVILRRHSETEAVGLLMSGDLYRLHKKSDESTNT